METLHEAPLGWHLGEKAIHSLLRAPTSQTENPTVKGLPARYAFRVADSSLVAFGALDAQGRPWTTVWGGEKMFARQVARDVLAVQCLVDKRNDPVVRALLGPAADSEEVVRPVRLLAEGQEPKLMSALSIEPETRDRVKLAGCMAVGTVASKDGVGRSVGEIQVAMLVQESLGNCPKYINKKRILPHIPSPTLASTSLPLPREALELIDRADIFFLSSTNGQTMDTNNRGGPAGLIRVVENTEHAVTLVYPEYSGNRLYQTLGNLHTNPKIGIVVPDFVLSDALFLTGETELLIGPRASALLPHSKLAVKITVSEARFVKDALSFRGVYGEPSPYTPAPRRLVTEQKTEAGQGESDPVAIATLTSRQAISSSVNRYVFKLSPSRGRKLEAWKPGQYVTLDFNAELDNGWSHMRDDDPLSLNDDFVRTFTISSPPPPLEPDAVVEDGTTMEITVKRHGPATSLLARHHVGVPLELPVLGFGGDASFRITTAEDNAKGLTNGAGRLAVFVAGGVGITPLLAQAPSLLTARGKENTRFRVVWGLRATDMPLAIHVLKSIYGLGCFVNLYITGEPGEKEMLLVKKAEEEGAGVFFRRVAKGDLLGLGAGKGDRKFFLCTNPGMLEILSRWLEGEEVISESFNY